MGWALFPLVLTLGFVAVAQEQQEFPGFDETGNPFSGRYLTQPDYNYVAEPSYPSYPPQPSYPEPSYPEPSYPQPSYPSYPSDPYYPKPYHLPPPPKLPPKEYQPNSYYAAEYTQGPSYSYVPSITNPIYPPAPQAKPLPTFDPHNPDICFTIDYCPTYRRTEFNKDNYQLLTDDQKQMLPDVASVLDSLVDSFTLKGRSHTNKEGEINPLIDFTASNLLTLADDIRDVVSEIKRASF